MKIQAEIDVHPFDVPDTVGMKGADHDLALSSLTPDSLSLMCDEWRKRVFQKAGMEDPEADAARIEKRFDAELTRAAAENGFMRKLGG